MPDLPARTALFEVFAREVTTRAAARSTGRQITAAEIFTPGSDINLIGAGASAIGEEVMRQTARSFRDLTFDAEGEQLDRTVAERFGDAVKRKTAAPARATLAFARPTGTFGGFTYAAGSRLTTPSGVVFETRDAAVFSGSTLGPVSVTARAVNAGTAGNVAANTITQFITVRPDVTITVTNPEPAAGGDAKETDTAFRARARGYLAAVSKGTLGAVRFGAVAVPGVRQASAIEEVDTSGVLTGRVLLYIADANGQANAALIADVTAGLREYRSGGLPVIVIGGVPVFQAIQYHLAFEAGVDTIAAFDAVAALTVARVNQGVPNGALLRSLLFEVARSVAGVIVNADAVTVPAGDVVPAAGSGQTIRTSRDLVSNA